ncbi:GntR family transcriptional regulator [Mangrovactinospora gilvigrisea]|uniref:GntR family transcriptional regulator n=1 Tax=Mangrovactinospora gilvigrisea TaxID=1428644 RepID=A0A1J7BIQ9_9ACTN|nr:FadR/GntR family transcriptional regulator [Mangrovactinospora gilvigrisea]OIV38469.1 GntR family transcriptional regulator [Mangrovactinospora gilvigrisea]
MPLHAAGRHSLVDHAIEQLRAELAAGTWPVGSRIPTEHELAEHLQVGRNTVREAVRVLAHTGLLRSRQGEGTFVVSTVDPESALAAMRRAGIRDVLEVRVALETDAARLAAVRRTPDDLAAMRAALADEQDVLDEFGPGGSGTIDPDLAFHTALVDAAHNPALSGVYGFFRGTVREAMLAAFGDEGMPTTSVATHLALVEAVASGDPDEAEAACRRLLDEPVQAVHTLLDQE